MAVTKIVRPPETAAIEELLVSEVVGVHLQHMAAATSGAASAWEQPA
jgi:hypothetical protein